MEELHSSYLRPDGTNICIGFMQLCDRAIKNQFSLGCLKPL